MPSLTFVVLVAAIGLLVLLPTRRLFVGGWTSGPLTVYFVGMIVLGLLVAELRGPARYLVPILVLAYIAPFITVRQGLHRIRERLNGGSPHPPGGGGAGGAAGEADGGAANVGDRGWRPFAGRRPATGPRPTTRARPTTGARPAAGPRPAPRNVTPPEAEQPRAGS